MMARWELGLGNANQLGALAAIGYAACGAYGAAFPPPAPGTTTLHFRLTGTMLVVLTAASGLLLVGSLSRGGTVAALLSLALAGLWPRALARRVVPAALGVLLVVAVLAWPRGGDRLTAATRLGQDPSIATRLAAWQGGLAIIASQPAVGCGDLGIERGLDALVEPPAHLRGSSAWPLPNLLNGILDGWARHGVLLTVGVLCLFAGCVACGLGWGWRGSAAGLALASASLAWFIAGQFTCTWWTDRTLAVGLPSAAALTVAWLWWRSPPTRQQLLLTAAAAVAAAGVAAMALWAFAFVQLQSQPAGRRLLRSSVAMVEEWGLGPARKPHGTLIYAPGSDESFDETWSIAVRTGAKAGWDTWVVGTEPLRAGAVLPDTAKPRILVARGDGCGKVLGMRPWPAAMILLDCPPEMLGAVQASPVPVLLLHGLPDPRGWTAAYQAACAANSRCQLQEPPVGRLWSNRLPRLWPDAQRWLLTTLADAGSP